MGDIAEELIDRMMFPDHVYDAVEKCHMPRPPMAPPENTPTQIVENHARRIPLAEVLNATKRLNND